MCYMHSDWDNEPVVRWEAPEDGLFDIEAWWGEGAGGAVDCFLMMNGTNALVDVKATNAAVSWSSPSPISMSAGDTLDFWRVEAVETNHLIRLRAEMKVPGLAWLQFQVIPQSETQTLLTQTAFFAPKGLFGWLYWYVLYPIHSLIFSGMIRAIAARTQEIEAANQKI